MRKTPQRKRSPWKTLFFLAVCFPYGLFLMWRTLIVGGSTPVFTQIPEVETTYVYANDTGEYYHLRDCKYVNNYSRKYELPVAYYNGYLPCQECGAPTYMPGGAQ